MHAAELEYLNSGEAPSEPPKPAPLAADACSKCKGSGRFISYTGRDVGPCFTCGGDGKAKGADAALAKLQTEHFPDTQSLLVPLDLSKLPSGIYAVPGGDTRLKVRVKRPGANSRWHGFIFVDDGAEYGHGQRYGRQAPGKLYEGKVQDQLRAIMADPMAASAAYGKLTGTCGVCGRHLEDEESVARGIGPICFGKFGA